MPDPETEESRVSEYQSVFTAALRIFGALPQVLSVILSFAVVAYAVGWLQARAYFRAFNADWLLSQLSLTLQRELELSDSQLQAA